MKIILGTFKDNGDELAVFLEPRLGAKPLVSGGEITFDDDDMKKTIKARHVKTYVKRFVRKKGEKGNYKIIVEGKELRMIELEKEEEEEEEKKARAKTTPKKEEEEPEEEAKEEASEAEEPAETKAKSA